MMNVLFSVVGMCALMFCAFLLSENRKAINWKTVSRALMLQVGFAALVLYSPAAAVRVMMLFFKLPSWEKRSSLSRQNR